MSIGRVDRPLAFGLHMADLSQQDDASLSQLMQVVAEPDQLCHAPHY